MPIWMWALWKKLVLPPKSPSYKDTQEIINSFKKAILFRCLYMSIVTDMAGNVVKEMFFYAI